jgi:hypothetical protein
MHDVDLNKSQEMKVPNLELARVLDTVVSVLLCSSFASSEYRI